MTNKEMTLLALRSDQLQDWLTAADDDSRAWVESNGFKAKAGQVCLLPGSEGELGSALAGLGNSPGLYTLASLIDKLPEGKYSLQTDQDESVIRQLCLGIELARYDFTRYRKPRKRKVFISSPQCDESVRSLRDAVYQVRDLVNTPTDDMGPADLAGALKDLAAEHAAEYSEWLDEALISNECPSVYAVGRAADSDRRPRLSRLDWGRDESHPRIVIVGKGVCFDTGGLNLKGADGMRNMKKDMGGAAHAIALAGLVMRAALPVRMTVLLPIVENAVSANAYRPGDIVHTRRGLTIEIGNTDAEGRVILADALTLGSELEPDFMIDFATLTGAARIAMGPELPPLFGRNTETVQALQRVSDSVSDGLWPFPLHEPYREFLRSQVADIANNASTPMGGCITAALFLDRFVDKGIDWCHVDTFAWNIRSKAGRPEGGEAIGCRAVFAYLQERYG